MALVAGIIFVVFTIILRLVPHAPNFVPVAALALWAGVYFPKKWGLIAPIAVMFISDALIGFYDWRLMLVVYVSFIITGFIGWLIKNNPSVAKIAMGSLAGSMLFFIATNFAVWALSSWYPHTLYGLIDAYTMGIPFLRNTLVGDLFYSGLFFGSYAFATIFAKHRAGSLDLSPRVS